MKRIGKILLATVLVLALCLCLCSCAALDELKESRAELTKDENGKTVILFRGSVYRSTRYIYNGQTVYLDHFGTAYLADPDVPALLLPSFGTACSYSKDATIIEANGNKYVREDQYDVLRDLWEGRGFSRWALIDPWDEDRSLIPDEYTDLLNTLTSLADNGDVSLPAEPDGAFYTFSRIFFRCDKDLTFLTTSYYLVRLTYYDSEDARAKDTYIYNGEFDLSAPVPEEYLPAVDRMIEDLDLF